jgi:hypothetical protein
MRLMGDFRGQSHNVEAPVGLEANDPWKVSEIENYVGWDL